MPNPEMALSPELNVSDAEVQESVERSFSFRDMKQGFTNIAEKARDARETAASVVTKAKENPRETIAFIGGTLGSAGIAAANSIGEMDVPAQIAALREMNKTSEAMVEEAIVPTTAENWLEAMEIEAAQVSEISIAVPDTGIGSEEGDIDVAPPIPVPVPGPLDAPDAIPDTRPRDLGGLEGEGDVTVPDTGTATLEGGTAIPYQGTTTAQLNPTAPTPDTITRHEDIVVPVPMPEREINVENEPNAEQLNYWAYKIQPGDTLSDIINEQVYQREVNPYFTDENGETHFSDEYIEASKEIAIVNLQTGKMYPPHFTEEGDQIGLIERYNETNEQMTVGQKVEYFALRISDVTTNQPGERKPLEELFNNEIEPELVPHVLRYLLTHDVIYLPEYDLESIKSADSVQQEQENEEQEPPRREHVSNDKYFNEFGGKSKFDRTTGTRI